MGTAPWAVQLTQLSPSSAVELNEVDAARCSSMAPLNAVE